MQQPLLSAKNVVAKGILMEFILWSLVLRQRLPALGTPSDLGWLINLFRDVVLLGVSYRFHFSSVDLCTIIMLSEISVSRQIIIHII